MPHDQAYLQAEKKIEEALKSSATELDLSGMELTELPESLGQLTQLQSLNLSHNQLTTLPETLWQLTQLQSLDLSYNRLASLPNWVGELKQLREIHADFPIDKSGAIYNNPVLASVKGLDGRTVMGTIDDYWISYEDTETDPYSGNDSGSAVP